MIRHSNRCEGKHLQFTALNHIRYPEDEAVTAGTREEPSLVEDAPHLLHFFSGRGLPVLHALLDREAPAASGACQRTQFWGPQYAKRKVKCEPEMSVQHAWDFRTHEIDENAPLVTSIYIAHKPALRISIVRYI